MRKLLIMLPLAIIMLLLLAVVPVWAYFNIEGNTVSQEYLFQDGTVKVTVANETALRRCSQDVFDNYSDRVSMQGARRYFVLAGNISLTADITITADCAIDLAGYQIDLNGYTLTVEHYYDGELTIFSSAVGGLIMDGTLLLNIPNALYVIDEGVLDASLTVNAAVYDEAALAERIFAFVEDRLTEGDAGKYYLGDVNLPFNYYNYDVQFSYLSSNTSLLTNIGKLIGSTKESVSLSLTITIGGNTYNSGVDYAGGDYTVEIVPASSAAWHGEIAKEVFEQNFVQPVGNVYTLSNSIALIKAIAYASVNYSYEVKDQYGTPVSNYIIGNYLSSAAPDENVSLYLYVTASNAYGSSTFEPYALNLLGETSLNEIINMVLSDCGLSNPIVFAPDELDVYRQLPSASDYTSFGLTDITYTLIGNNVNSYYIIENIGGNTFLHRLAEPDAGNFYYLQATFYIDGLTLVKAYEIKYDPDGSGEGGGGSGIGTSDRFLTTFNYLKAHLDMVTDNMSTYKSFSMPAYANGFFVYYRIVVTLKGTAVETEAQDAIITVGTITAVDSAVPFTINIPNLADKEYAVTVHYYYNTVYSSHPLDDYNEFTVTSTFNIPAVILKTNIDPNLYNQLKYAYDPWTLEELDAISESVYYPILVSSLSVYRSNFTLSTATIGPVTLSKTIEDFSGIEYLVNTAAFDFSGSSFGQRVEDYLLISRLDKLISLDISGNGLKNIESIVIPSSLRMLDLSNNNIARFDVLEKVLYEHLNDNMAATDVFSLYVYGNTSGFADDSIMYSLNSVTSTYYGSLGLLNSFTFGFLVLQRANINTSTYYLRLYKNNAASYMMLNNFDSALIRVLSSVQYRRNLSMDSSNDTPIKYLPVSVTSGSITCTCNWGEDPSYDLMQRRTTTRVTNSAGTNITTVRVPYTVVYSSNVYTTTAGTTRTSYSTSSDKSAEAVTTETVTNEFYGYATYTSGGVTYKYYKLLTWKQIAVADWYK